MKTSNGYAILRAWCEDPKIGIFCPAQDATINAVSRLWEEFHYYQSGDLDTLIEKLEGREHFSSTKESALKRLRPWLEKIFGPSKKIVDPEFVVRDRQRSQARAARKGQLSALEKDEPSNLSTTEEELSMSTVVIKSKKSAPVKKPDVKALKKSNKVATKSLTEKKGRPGAFSDEQKITVLAKENPKREGSASHKEFSLYAKNKTVGAFLKAGGTAASLRWDSEKEFIKIS